MQFHEMMIFGGIWGWLMFFFLTPHQHSIRAETKDKSTKIGFPQAFKKSLIKVVLHKKAMLAAILLITTIIYFGYYFNSIPTYIKNHGESEFTIVPKVDDSYYLVGVCIYAVFLYICAALGWTEKYLKR
ncbi:hypothetical protein [Ureibacillus acetophenoni]|uniref:Uncharacterized protein n=1 Tax=Ureibacillus acetophenoni TaxID=614649 RepID=A0A285UD95_9BACL|nr:hypothetical protein [Ureibacillus acetophenoni]SOC39904.1 hypothetical protein SAMN05877842_106179 [Ureibacillus acetophenoni]